ncbi:MAG: CHAT domain-containing protein, partial [Burkholderiaceae bacterium]
LQRQQRAAQLLEDRPRQIELLRQLIEAGRGRPGGEGWIRAYLSTEFTWGSSGRALEACEPFIVDPRLAPATRAAAALRQSYFTAQTGERALLSRLWSRADALTGQALAQGGPGSELLPVDRLQVRAEVERREGNLAASLASLREAVGLGRRLVAAAQQRNGGDARAPAVLDAYGWYDGSQGMLVYALLRMGRSPEAVEVAQANVALWRAGQLGDNFGARWSYRLASALIASQQYEAGLAAAGQAEEMLQRAGASAASHTRWLAREARVRGLIGTQRWKEADESYSQFLAEVGGDALARERARDNRLIALLAAKNGRLDEALEVAERSHRYRLRLYGADHPQTQEAAGVRAVVRLRRGDVVRAMSDYESLFAATLDNPGGWLDLDARGLRGFVLGIAFAEFMNYVAEQALLGRPPDARLIERARQIADRSTLGATQRALTDSTARVLAATPGLRALLEQEQAQRQIIAAQFGQLSATLAEEDRLRKEMGGETFKALPREQRKPQEEKLRALREQIKGQQGGINDARAALARQREGIAAQFPAYADLVTPSTPGSERLRALLAPGEGLLIVHPLAGATLVWLVGSDAHQGFHASRLEAKALAARVAELRRGLDLGSAPAGRAPALPLEQLHALYRELLGPLASLPLATLVTEPSAAGAPPAWLLRQMAVTQLPAASALLALRRVGQPEPAARPLLGFGDPLFDLAARPPMPPVQEAGKRLLGVPLARSATRYDAELGFRYAEVPPLPDTRAELQAVAAALGADPQADLVLGAAATRRAVLAAPLRDRRVVAFATHGLMPGELPGVSKPALAMAADRDERESPLLELDDVLSLRMNAQWVLLSACNTAAGEAGGAAMSGLVRGFFFAGARSVLATHWAVDSESAAGLSASTFKARGLSRAESLRQAQLAMLDGRLGGGRWSHPFHWAPYALFGDPSR